MCIQEFPFCIWICKRRGCTWVQCQPCQATTSRRLFPLPVSGNENIWTGPKSANNAAIQHVIPQLSDGNTVIRRHFENRSDNSLSQCKLIPPLLMVRICLIRPSHQDKTVCGCGGHREAYVCADGPWSNTDKAKLNAGSQDWNITQS